MIHGDAAQIATVDDKAAFAAAAASLGLPVPDTHRVTAREQVATFDFPDATYVLKSIPYDPVQPAGPHPAAVRDTRRDGGLRPVQADRPDTPVDPAGVRRRSGVLHAQHGPRRAACRSTAAAARRRSRSTTRWSTSPRSRRGYEVRRRARADRAVLVRLHRGRGRHAVRDRVQPAHALGDHHVLRPPGPGPCLSGRPAFRRSGRARRQPADVLALPRAVAAVTQPGGACRTPAGHPPRQGGDFRLVATRCRSCWCTTCRSRGCCWGTWCARKGWIRIDFNIGKLVEPAGD